MIAAVLRRGIVHCVKLTGPYHHRRAVISREVPVAGEQPRKIGEQNPGLKNQQTGKESDDERSCFGGRRHPTLRVWYSASRSALDNPRDPCLLPPCVLLPIA